MFIRKYRLAWLHGFVDGERGKRHQTLKGIPGFRYTNGWIEGRAKRLGYDYGLTDVTEQELEEARRYFKPEPSHAWDNANWALR
ncbi:hypothetical protein QC823_06765 [Halomonas vilamensis]|uniref:Uncharacterized protein n=1 Tax=Vreelandella vilamensis TaxID=531309 RepID=A0ABU1H316_9GAMM|nr:hypothetical protein [Halomonas vilamensis]MDR5898687.1 hypothetical protein [Halomonas vilamensis]